MQNEIVRQSSTKERAVKLSGSIIKKQYIKVENTELFQTRS